MADNNKKKYIKYENTTYILQDSRFPEPAAADNGKVLGVVNGEYALKNEEGGSGSAPVTSVNGKTGAVVLDAEDVGALPDDTVIPPTVTEQTVSGWGFTKNTGDYSKPSSGIPKTDLAADVQESLGKADTALQQHQSLSGYATETYVQQQIAAIPDELPTVTASDNGKVLAVNNGAWSADNPVIVSGTDAQVTNAVNDYLTQHGVPLRLSEEIKQALLDCFENVAWINDDGQTYYDALYAALYPQKTLVSISASFNQGSAVIYSTDSLDTLKPYLTVTAHYDDSSTSAVTNYTLSGTLNEGTSTVTVLYSGKTTTFTVNVAAPATLVSISAVFTQGSAVIYTDDSLDTLKQYLVVTATMADSTTQTVTNYTLSGTLTVGTSTITVSYGGKTDTFTVAVSEQKLYQLCEYVETDGASRIDTGVQFDGTKDIEVTVEASYAKTLKNGEYTQFGWSAGGSIGVIYGNFGGETINVWTDGITPSAEKNLSGINLMTETNMVIQAGSDTNTIYTFTNANGTKTFTRTHANVENRTFLPFPLFAISLQNSFEFTRDGFRIKSAIIKVGGTIVRNMKACYRKSDNVIGFFDEVNSVFYTNVGTGAFTKGGDIS